MKVVGITRIRNEQEVIGHTLDHLKNFCDEVFVFDDCSTDKTVDICKNHSLVNSVIQNKKWESDPKQRLLLEGSQRQAIYNKCLTVNPTWVYYFDADEFIDFDYNQLINSPYDSYKLRFFDYYITKDDVDKHFLDRKYCGREYREILCLFKAQNEVRFSHREPTLMNGTYSAVIGKVKHYGKAISVEEWEKTCDYYANHLYEVNNGVLISEKWKKRKGKAIHSKSDFDTELITWDETDNFNVITKML